MNNPFDDLRWKALSYVSEATANAECPFCRNATWAYLKGNDSLPATTLLQYERDGRTTSVPGLVLTCEKCGFVRHHDLAMIKTKLDERDGSNES